MFSNRHAPSGFGQRRGRETRLARQFLLRDCFAAAGLTKRSQGCTSLRYAKRESSTFRSLLASFLVKSFARLVVLGGVVCVALVACGRAARTSTGGFVAITNGTLSVDLGTVVRGEFVTVPLMIENSSLSPMTVSRVIGSCSCVKATVRDEIIAPGNRLRACVVLDSINMPASATGTLRAYSKDGHGNESILTTWNYSITVVNRFLCQPSSIVLPEVRSARGVQEAVVVRSMVGGLVSLRRIESPYDWLLCEVVETDQRTGQILASVRSGVSPGHYGGEIILHVDDVGADRRIRIPIAIEVGGNVIVEPRVALLRPNERGDSFECVISVSSADDDNQFLLTNISIESPDDATRTAITTTSCFEGGNSWRILLTADAAAVTGILKGRLVIATSDSYANRVIIPFWSIGRR